MMSRRLRLRRLLGLCGGVVAAAQAAGLRGPAEEPADASLFWGSYRPNLYVGWRARAADSPLFGLLWYGLHDYTSFGSVRHACEQDDGIVYAWDRHDGRSYGSQTIRDPRNNALLETAFLKTAGDDGAVRTLLDSRTRPTSAQTCGATAS